MLFNGLGTTQQDVILTVKNQTDPAAAFTVVEPPTLSIASKLSPTTPDSQIVLGGQSYWTPFSEYTITNGTSQPRTITQALIGQVSPTGDTADFAEVALAADGVVWLKGNSQWYGNPKFYVWDIGQSGGLIIPPQSTKAVQVWAKMANVMPLNIGGGQWTGFPRSGHMPSLRLDAVAFKDGANLVPQFFDPATNSPNPMVLRKSRPNVIPMQLTSTVLTNVDQDLAKVLIAADQAGAVQVKKFAFTYSKSAGVTLSNYRIRRGATDLNITDYQIFDDGQRIYVVFNTPETIVGSGLVYTLHATVSGAMPGKSVALAFDAAQAPYPVTGKLTSFGGTPGPILVPGNWMPPNTPPAEYTGTSLWSDGAEVPLTEQSVDWTNDVWADFMTGTFVWILSP